MNLSKLEKVNLREVWKHEATDFTNWLAKPENLELLSDEIGINITLVQTEASVGKFNVDILAEEENTSRKIVIENPENIQTNQVKRTIPVKKLELSRTDDMAEGNQGQAAEEPKRVTPVRVGPKVGRNEPCPCGSGKKYKQCHGKQ